MGKNIANPAIEIQSIKSKLCLGPLLNFWQNELVPQCPHMESMFAELADKIRQNPQIDGTINDISVFKNHQDIITPLMSAVFAPASFNRDIMAALTPCKFEPFFVTPQFQELFLDNNNIFKPGVRAMVDANRSEQLINIYLLVLERIYGFNCQRFDAIDIKKVADKKTGLYRYFSITPDSKFVEIAPLETPRILSPTERKKIYNNITDIEFLSRHIDLNKFEFTGFTIVRAVDVTKSEIISALERDLINQQSIFSSDGIKSVESRLQTLFQRPDMSVSICAIHGDQVMIIQSDCKSDIDCLFANSLHISLDDIKGSVWLKAAQGKNVFYVSDLSKKESPLTIEQQAVSAGIRSMLLSPLSFQGEVIGLLEVFTPTPNDFNPIDIMVLEQITPIFSSALRRGQDELNKNVQGIIKEKCTAVHPSVEWRFEKAAFAHMERLRHGSHDSQMEPIIFKDVVPFYGQSDIRGSSLARNKGIQQDLTQQLTMALDIIEEGAQKRPWPLLGELKYQLETMIHGIAQGVTSSDENSVFSLLKNELEPAFDELIKIGPEVEKQILSYTRALDPGSGIIYNKRKEYEESVSRLNNALSGYLEKEDYLIQQTFPHYFEKRQTDGVDYMMYVGSSMMENQVLANFHIKDLTLWQILIACGLAWHTQKIRPDLKVSLDTCHLILVNHTPLSIRFRFDEKRFDVDGAYDVRHEIIKSRLDKALIKGSGERLTQPRRIALVYSNPLEGKQIRQHIDFMIHLGKLNNDLEILDLDDMPDVRGLKALRIGINTESMVMENIMDKQAGQTTEPQTRIKNFER